MVFRFKDSMSPNPDSQREPSREELIALIAALTAKNAALKERIAELERRLGLTSSNSGKPPSSDGLKKPPRAARTKSLRGPSDRPSGGQKGHKGETLEQVAAPDHTVDHVPPFCAACRAAVTLAMSTGHSARQLRLHIRWQGGAIETIELRLSPNRAEAVRYPDAFVAHIRALAAAHDDDEIVALLNRNGLKSSTGRRLTGSMIRWIRYKHHIPSPQLPTDTFNVKQVRQRYGVSMWVVYYWIDGGLITAQKRKPGLPYAITITDATDHRLRDWVANSSRITARSPNPN